MPRIATNLLRVVQSSKHETQTYIRNKALLLPFLLQVGQRERIDIKVVAELSHLNLPDLQNCSGKFFAYHANSVVDMRDCECERENPQNEELTVAKNAVDTEECRHDVYEKHSVERLRPSIRHLRNDQSDLNATVSTLPGCCEVAVQPVPTAMLEKTTPIVQKYNRGAASMMPVGERAAQYSDDA